MSKPSFVDTDSVIDALRAIDGPLFLHPAILELYRAINSVVLRCLVGAYVRYVSPAIGLDPAVDGVSAFQKIVDALYNWNGPVAEEELAALKSCHTNPAMAELVQSCAKGFSRIYYAEERRTYPDATFRVHTPKPEALLRGVYIRMTAPHSSTGVRDGTFFKLDAVKQDFVMRNAFRDALSACITVEKKQKSESELQAQKNASTAVERAVVAALAPSPVTRLASIPAPAPFSPAPIMPTAATPVSLPRNQDTQTQTEMETENDGVPDGEVFPSDSISSVMLRTSAHAHEERKSSRHKMTRNDNAEAEAAEEQEQEREQEEEEEEDDKPRPRLDLDIAAPAPTPAPAPAPKISLFTQRTTTVVSSSQAQGQGQGKGNQQKFLRENANDDMRSVDPGAPRKSNVAESRATRNTKTTQRTQDTTNTDARSVMSRASQQLKPQMLPIEVVDAEADAPLKTKSPPRKVLLSREPELKRKASKPSKPEQSVVSDASSKRESTASTTR
jgi:hypothetical protein